MIKEVIFGVGCFWCVEVCFLEFNGVESVQFGYFGGEFFNVIYKEVCLGIIDYVEVLWICYDDEKVFFDQLLEVFWFVYDFM